MLSRSLPFGCKASLFGDAFCMNLKAIILLDRLELLIPSGSSSERKWIAVEPVALRGEKVCTHELLGAFRQPNCLESGADRNGNAIEGIRIIVERVNSGSATIFSSTPLRYMSFLAATKSSTRLSASPSSLISCTKVSPGYSLGSTLSVAILLHCCAHVS